MAFADERIEWKVDDRPIENDPSWPGHVRLYEVHRGKHHPPPRPAD